MKWIVITVVILFTFCAKTGDDGVILKDVIDLIPLDNEISGWTRSSPTQIAENEQQLCALINGAGQIYIDNGFAKCAFQDYQGTITGPVDLKLRIFDMADTTNAETIYDILANGSEIPWTDNHAGTAARYRLVTGVAINYYELDFWDDRFYAWIEIDDGSPAGLDIAKLFALNVSQAIQDTTAGE
jgi:hypothetical protein